MMTRPAGATAAILAVSLLAGCAGTGPVGGPPDGSAPGSSTVVADPTGPTGPTDPTGPIGKTAPADPTPGGKPGATGTQTLTGTVTTGVEPHCLMLTGGAGTHQLIISDTAARSTARVGASVTVVGRAEPGMMTTCQQGTPFIVSQVRPN